MAKRFNPEAAVTQMLAAGAEPLEPYQNANTRWPSRCLNCGNKISPWFGNVRSGHNPCRYCAAKQRAATQSVDNEDAIGEMLAAGVEPLEPYKSTNTPWHSHPMPDLPQRRLAKTRHHPPRQQSMPVLRRKEPETEASPRQRVSQLATQK